MWCYSPEASTRHLWTSLVFFIYMVMTITPTLTNSFHILLRYCLWLPDWQHRQVVATRYPLLRSVVPIDVVLFPRRIISTLTNFACIFYLYGHGCLNASDGIIYLRYRLLSALVPQMFFSISVSHYTRHHSGTSYNCLQVAPYRLNWPQVSLRWTWYNL